MAGNDRMLSEGATSNGEAQSPSQELPHLGLANGGERASGAERVIEIQRARLLGAMVKVSGERGAANVSVAHVVERAGVSRRTFYELFDDREECFLAAFDDAIAYATRYVLDGYDPKAKWAERVRGLSPRCFSSSKWSAVQESS